MSSIVEVAVALTTALAGHTFSEAMAVERTYDPEHGLEELVTPRLVVVPRTKKQTKEGTREADFYEYEIDVAVQVKLTATGDDLTAETDAWMDVADEVERFLNRLRPETLLTAKVVGITHNPVYWPDHMKKFGVFTSVITPTVRVLRAA